MVNWVGLMNLLGNALLGISTHSQELIVRIHYQPIMELDSIHKYIDDPMVARIKSPQHASHMTSVSSVDNHKNAIKHYSVKLQIPTI